MKKQELYNNTVDILVQAYFNDTLKHGDCWACAVGNMIAGNCGYELKYIATEYVSGFLWLHNGKNIEPKWDELFVTLGNGEQRIEPRCFNLETKRQCEATGYNWHDLAAIEYAFETAPKGDSDDEWMFNGLMAVIDVLDKIHENTDATHTISAKQRFVKATIQ